MRAVDLALYADALAGEAATLSARLEHTRSRLYQSAIERRARVELPGSTVSRLQSLGLLSATDDASLRRQLRELTASLAAVEELQTWVEVKLAGGRDGYPADGPGTGGSPGLTAA